MARDTEGMQITTSIRSTHWDESSDHDSPIALLLHGYGSHEGDLPGLAQWLPAGMPWVSPRAPLTMPAMGFAWFPLSLPGLPDPAAIDEATSVLWDWIDTEIGTERPLVPLGFSQGGLMALQLLRTRPERVATTVVLAGLITGTRQSADDKLQNLRPPVFWGRGDADTVIPIEGVNHLSEFLPEHTTPTVRTYAGLGHSVDFAVMEDVQTFLAETLS